MTDLLQCIGVQRRFGDFLAAKGIDLTVRHGEIVGIIGANGAGKTTLFNIISGYLKPTDGRIMFRGMDVTGLPPRFLVRQGIARSFQVPQLFGRSTARENMMIALSLLAERRPSILRRFSERGLIDQAERVLSAYGIGEHADAVVANIPQGVRKLLDIAMATCADPALVLLDEPTSGVSSDEKNQFVSGLIERFRKASTAVIFIEHDMDIVREHASRVIALYEGRIIADGAADVIFADEDVIRFITGAAGGASPQVKDRYASA
ncbi:MULTISPECIES: ABC transporter ATP-binding protein [Bradyrhizobium]|uniref:ABC transporter ATP-binding protein n=1 Tax=Bradyrhizobium elkanii TaxID=29448 RepID=UPI0004044B0F|nr:ABC transporter ATP-binding protein [Bradyrhizobium elkanii]